MSIDQLAHRSIVIICRIRFLKPEDGGMTQSPFTGMIPAFRFGQIAVSVIVSFSPFLELTHSTWLEAAIFIADAKSFPSEIWREGQEFELISGSKRLADGAITSIVGPWTSHEDFCSLYKRWEMTGSFE